LSIKAVEKGLWSSDPPLASESYYKAGLVETVPADFGVSEGKKCLVWDSGGGWGKLFGRRLTQMDTDRLNTRKQMSTISPSVGGSGDIKMYLIGNTLCDTLGCV